MDHTRDRLQETAQPRGVVKDVQRLRQNGSASVAEIREFLSRMKGRSPEEVLGIVTSSGLVKGIMLSTIAFIGVIALFTFVPYAISGPPRPKEKPKPVAQAPAKTSEPTAAKTTAHVAAKSPANTGPDTKNIGKALGIDEVKGTDPKDAPDLDNLLDKKFE